MANRIVFAVRGNSLNARYSNAGNVPILYGTNVASVVTSGGGNLSGGYIDLQNNTNAAHGAFYPGFSNFSDGVAFSILLRMSVTTASGTMALFGVGAGSFLGSAEMWISGGNTLNAEVDSETGTTLYTGSHAWTITTGQYYDIVMTCTGTNAANGVNMYVDASMLFQGTMGSSYPNPRVTTPTHLAIGYGNGSSLTTTKIKVDEFAIWNYVIDPTSVALDSGNGSLNGSSRTSLVTVAAYNGLAQGGSYAFCS